MSPSVSAPNDEPLVRALGVRQVTASIVNTTVGAGIFLLPALVSRELGAAAPLAFVACGLAMALIVSAFAIAGSRVATTGGIYAYVETAFGPFVGFLAGVLQWLVFILAVASVSSALLDQLSVFVPALGGVVWRLGTLALILSGLAFVNARGVRSGARTIEVMTAAKLVPLLLFVAVGAFAIQPSNLAWPGLPGGDALGRASLMLIFAFMGIEVALAPSGEVRDPARTVPRSIYLALAVTTVLYVAIQLVAQGVLGPALADQSRAPLAEATSRFMGSAGRSLILLGAMCSMFGYLSGDMLSSPRNLYAFARAGVLPAVLARVHPTRQTPHVAIWTHAALVFVLASTNSFEHLLVVSNVAGLALYLMGCAAAMELTRRNVQGAGVPFAIPGTHVVPILASVVILLIMSSATAKEMMVTAGTLGVASLLYLARRR